jgi:hypothetical protein
MLLVVLAGLHFGADVTDVYEYTGWSLRKTAKELARKSDAAVIDALVKDEIANLETETKGKVDSSSSLWKKPGEYKELPAAARRCSVEMMEEVSGCIDSCTSNISCMPFGSCLKAFVGSLLFSVQFACWSAGSRAAVGGRNVQPMLAGNVNP